MPIAAAGRVCPCLGWALWAHLGRGGGGDCSSGMEGYGVPSALGCRWRGVRRGEGTRGHTWSPCGAGPPRSALAVFLSARGGSMTNDTATRRDLPPIVAISSHSRWPYAPKATPLHVQYSASKGHR